MITVQETVKRQKKRVIRSAEPGKKEKKKEAAKAAAPAAKAEGGQIMATLQAPLFSATGEAKGQFDLPESIFTDVEGSRRVLQEVIVGMQANQRRGTSSTKTRGLVSGGGRKPWKQKGTGNARSGSIRSPLWRKGGIIFGPLPRSYRTDLDQSKRLIALQTALVEKAKASELGVFEALKFENAKTSEAQRFLK